jgi:hypothetical protein
MYGLSVGVQRINQILPLPVYALLSGVNSATVGIIALAAVQLAEKAIKDKLSRILVILGACAGLCYNALWYFPVLMLLGGLATVIWDGWMKEKCAKLRDHFRRKKSSPEGQAEETGADKVIPEQRTEASDVPPGSGDDSVSQIDSSGQDLPQTSKDNGTPLPSERGEHSIQIRVGISLMILFFGKSLI